MAGNIKGITVEIGGNTTGLDAALKDVNDNARSLASELKTVEKQLKLDPSNIVLLAEKQRILNEQAENTSEKLRKIEEAQGQVNEQFKSGKITEEAYRAFNLELGKTQAELTNTEKKLDGMSESAKKTGNEFNIMGGIVANVAKVAATATAAIATAAATVAVKLGTEVVNAFADCEQLVGGVETLFKDSSAAVQGYAENAFKTAGMSANQYMETVTGFSASLISSLEGDTAKAAQVADMAITDMSDNANKMGTDIASIQNAYQGFAKQNYTMLDNLKLGYGGTKTEMQRLLADAEKISGIKYDLSSFADLTEAIHVVQTEMGITGTTAKEATETISGSIAGMNSSIQNLMAGLGNANADIGLLTGNVVEAFQNVVGNVTPIIQNLVSALPTAINAVVSAMGDMLPELLDAARDLFGQVLRTIITMIPELIPEILDTITATVDTLFELLLPKFTGLGEMISGVITGAVNALSGALGFLAGNFETIASVLIVTTSAFVAYKTAMAISSVIQGVTTALSGMTVAQYALNLAMSLNPVGLIVAGIAALTAGAVLLGAALSQPRDEIKALADEAEKFNEKNEKMISGSKDARTAFEDTGKSIENEAESTTKLVSRLEELNNKTDKTNVENLELKDIVEQLNTRLPTLALSFNEVSGTVQGYTGNIYDLIEAKRQLMQYEKAEQEYLSATSRKDELNDQIKQNRESMEKAQAALDEHKANDADLKSINVFKSLAYKAELKELEKAVESYTNADRELQKERIKTNHEIQAATAVIDEYVNTIEPLPEVVSDVTEAEESATKATTDHTKELKSNSNAVKQSEAEYKKIQATYQGNENSLEALTAKVGGLNSTYSKNQERIDLLRNAISKETAALDENADSYDENVAKIQSWETELTNTETAQINLGREIQTMTGYMDEAANSSDGLATTIDANGKIIKDTSEADARAAEAAAKKIEAATKKAAKESEKAIEEIVKPIDESFKGIEKSVDSLIKSYESARDSAKNNFQSQLDYFRETAEETELSAKSILDSMTTFTGEAIGYNEDLARATEAGFSDGFVATLTDGSEKSKQVLKTILDEYDKVSDGLNADDAKSFVDDFNWAFSQTNKATDALAETVAEMKTGFSAKAEEMLQIASDFGDNLSQYTGEAFDDLKNRVDTVMSDLTTLIKPKGEKTVTELKDGIEEKAPEAVKMAETLASDIIAPIEALEKKAFTSGQNYVKGYMLGVKSLMDGAEAAGADVANASLQGLRVGLDEHSPSRESGKSGVDYVLGFVNAVADNLWRVGDVAGRMAGTALASTEAIIATSQQQLVDYYNTFTRFGDIDLSQFQNVFKDFSAMQGDTETSMATLGALINSVGLDLSTATSEIQRFKDSIHGLDREIITIWDAYGNTFQAGNMPGYMPDPDNPGMAIVNEEYWKKVEQIDQLAFNNYVDQLAREAAQIAEVAEESNVIIRDVMMINALDMESWGAYTAQMMSEGFTVKLRDELGNVIDATELFTGSIKETVETGLDIHSPSGFTEWVADMFNVGFIDKIRAGVGKAVSAVRDYTSAIKSEFSLIPATVGIASGGGVGIDSSGISISDKVRAAQNYTYNTSTANNNTSNSSFNQTNNFSGIPQMSDYQKIKQLERSTKEIIKHVIK